MSDPADQDGAVAPPPACAPRPPTILIVDPDRVSRRLAERALTRAGRTIETADRITGALELIQYGGVDLVVAETVLDDGSGRTLMDRATALCGPRAPAFLFLCATDDAGARAAYLRGGAADVMAKPFAPAELAARADVALQRRTVRAPFAPAALAGDGTIPLTDLLAMLELGRHSGRLAVCVGGSAAEVCIDRGRLVDARFGTLCGAPAALALFQSAASSYRFSAGPVTGELSISLTELQLEAAVELDNTRDGPPTSAADRLAELGVARTPIDLRRRRRPSSMGPRRDTRRDLARRAAAALVDPLLLGDLDLTTRGEAEERRVGERFLTVDLWTTLDDGIAALIELTSPVGHQVLLAAMRGEAAELTVTWSLGNGGLIVRLVDIEAPPPERVRRPADAIVLAPPGGELLGLHPARLAELVSHSADHPETAIAPIGGRALSQTTRGMFARVHEGERERCLRDATGDLRTLLAALIERWGAA